ISALRLHAALPDTQHVRGVLSMARSTEPNSAGSQFFICVKDSHFLDGQYTAFGKVISGMDVVDKIVNEPRDGSDNPNERIEMKSVTILSR
ncbi:MAG: peptidylprolyl isomerase, partial [Nitrospinae bacterium]|nr:peptidylprolyl isomerase [Nitrospinota bacterium]